MAIETDEYPERYFEDAAAGLRPFDDFEWFAIDSAGRVALLTSAGFGPIPLTVFRDRAAYFATAAYFGQLPPLGSHRLHRHRLGGGDWSSWASAAERGLFAYDWDSSTAGEYVPGQPYWLVASPEAALTVEGLPVSVREYLEPIRFGARFGDDLFPEREFPKVNL